MSHLESTAFGFVWGQLEVLRYAEIRGNKAVAVKTSGPELIVYVSPKGKKIRAFLDGRELK